MAGENVENAHPTIRRLAVTELDIESTDEPQENADYMRGYVIGSAEGYYRAALGKVADANDPSIIDELCAEIGFWRAVVDLHRQERGMGRGDTGVRLS